MGMCKGCENIFSVVEMKDGLCANCYEKEFGEPLVLNTKKEVEDNPVEPMSKSRRNGLIGVGLIAFVGIGVFVNSNVLNPPDSTIKKIAAQYTRSHASSVTVIDSYEKEGKKVQVVKTSWGICDMPMVKANGEWYGTGISCH